MSSPTVERPVFGRPEADLRESIAVEETQESVAGLKETLATPPMPAATKLPQKDDVGVVQTLAIPSAEEQTEKLFTKQPASDNSKSTTSATLASAAMPIDSSQNVVVADGSHQQFASYTAYNSTRREFLVTWLDRDQTAGISFMGRRLNEDGSPLGSEFLIATIGGTEPDQTKLVYSSSSDSYLLAWSDPNGGISEEDFCFTTCYHPYTLPEYNLYVLSITGDGIANSPATLVTDELTYYGSPVAVHAYDLIYNSQAGEYLLAWTQPSGGAYKLFGSCCAVNHPHRVVGQRFSESGGALGTIQLLTSMAGSGISLGVNGSGQYLLLFQQAYRFWSIPQTFGQIIDSGLSPVGGLVNIIPHDILVPASHLTYVPEEDAYILTWVQGSEPASASMPSRIFAKKISASSGQIVDAEVPILTGFPLGHWPIAGYNPSAGQALILANADQNPNLTSIYLDENVKMVSRYYPLGNDAGMFSLATVDQEDNPGWLVVWDRYGDVYGKIMKPMPTLFDASVLNGSCAGDCPLSASPATNPTVGGPINTRTGGVSFEASDISVPTMTGSLVFTRTYSSLATDLYENTLGYGWTHNFDSRLIFPTDPGGMAGLVLFKGHSTNLYQFIIKDDGSYRPGPGVFGSLTCTGGAQNVCVVTLSNQDSYTFLSGKLQTWQDSKGHTRNYNYDTSGRLVQVTDQATGRYLSFGYTGVRIETVSDHTGRSISFGYDAAGDLVTATNLGGGSWQYQYQSHRLTRVIDPGGNTIERTEYDTEGRATRQYDGKENLVVELTYNPDGTTVVKDANSNEETYTFNSRNILASEQSPATNIATKTYDHNFRPDSITDPGSNTTYLNWSLDGSDLTGIVDALGQQTNITYENHLPKTIIDSRGFQTSYSYEGTLLKSMSYGFTLPITYYYSYTSAGLLETSTDPLGKVTRYEYDILGQRTKVIENYDPNHSPNEQGLYNLTTIYGYDDLGRVIATTDRLGVTTKYEYDNAGQLRKTIRNFNDYPTLPQNYESEGIFYNLISEYRYDARGNQIASIDTLGIITRTYYDENGRPLTTVQNLAGQGIEIGTPPQRGSGTPEQNLRSDTVYDAAGNMIASIDVNGIISRTYYDAANRPVISVQNLVGQSIETDTPPAYNPLQPSQNLRTETVYDLAGLSIASIDTDGKITRTWYDKLNRPVTIVENLSGQAITAATPPSRGNSLSLVNLRTDMVYDANGNMIATTDPLGIITRTWYDALNRPITVVNNLKGWNISNPN
ncbi:MAG: DUF6531 domain-containing protein, partial [Anaerolineae bacterium]|nr:DUF6531 domain-containing protein [Anaerolineae bacterium]